MILRLTVALGIAIGLQAQPSDPAQVLLSAQQKIAGFMNRLPRYMCTETVERSIYEPPLTYRGNACDQGRTKPPLHLRSSDRLRLDVANTLVGEMFAWVQSQKFSDRDLLEIVNDGSISSGNFGSFLDTLFREDSNAIYSYRGDITEHGRTLSEFGFKVPVEQSHYRYGKGEGQFLTGYDGTFIIDPKSSDLVRLSIRTEALPADTHVCYTTTNLEYKKAHIHDLDLLLPSDAWFHVFHADGGESDNRMSFSGCHEFLGESTVSFGPPSESAAKPKPAEAAPVLVIPPGIEFKVVTTETIDTTTSAVGERLQAKLLSPIELHEPDSPTKVLVPAGAIVGARIVRLRWFYGTQTNLVLGVKLETVEVNGIPMRLDAAPYAAQRFQKRQGSLQKPINLGTLQSLADRSVTYEFNNVHRPYTIRLGLESNWVTALDDQ